jgi:hypothetical protein
MLAMVLLATAVPVTLSCMFDRRGARVSMTLSLDAAHGAVRYAFPATKRAVTSRALFVRDSVMFDGFTLDRRTLLIVREGDSVTASLYAQPREVRGRCRVDRPVSPTQARGSRGTRGT